MTNLRRCGVCGYEFGSRRSKVKVTGLENG